MLNDEDVTWLGRYPSLRYDGTKITGRLYFKMSYNRKTTEYTLSPNASDVFDKDVIYHIDDYEIRIEWRRGQNIPHCFESDGKLEQVGQAKTTHLSDMHVNANGDFCLAAPQKLDLEFKAGFNLQDYIEKFVIPFLFLQTHFSKTDVWAWPTAGHGLGGVLEWYHQQDGEADDTVARQLTIQYVKSYKQDGEDLLKRLLRGRYKGHMPCLCGVKHKIRKCSPNALYALNSLRKELIGMLIQTSAS